MNATICVSVLSCAILSAASSARPSVEGHIAGLRSSLPAVRRAAAAALGRTRDRAAVPALVETLEDPEPDVRLEAAKALGLLKDRRATLPLAKALGDGDANVRFYAAYALGELKDPRSAEPLLAALNDPEWCVRDQAAWALRELGDPNLINPLLAMLKERRGDPSQVLWILQRFEAKQVAGGLAGLLKQPEADLRKLAIRALAALSGPAASIEPVLGALGDSDAEVRRVAVEKLLELGDERARKPLEQLLARETDRTVRQAAEEAIFQMSPRKHLSAHWSFDRRDTSVAKDETGRGSDGQIHACTPVPGKVGHALRFGEGAYVELGRPPAVPIGGRPLTVMAWAKPETPDGVVVARGGAFCGFSLYIKGGAARFGITRAKDGPTSIATGREQVVGRWVHLAGVIKSDCIELYVDGRPAATKPTEGFLPGECGQGMEIGFDAANSPAEITDHFQGVIDEVKVFQAALSGEEIAEECRADDKK